MFETKIQSLSQRPVVLTSLEHQLSSLFIALAESHLRSWQNIANMFYTYIYIYTHACNYIHALLTPGKCKARARVFEPIHKSQVQALGALVCGLGDAWHPGQWCMPWQARLGRACGRRVSAHLDAFGPFNNMQKVKEFDAEHEIPGCNRALPALLGGTHLLQ